MAVAVIPRHAPPEVYRTAGVRVAYGLLDAGPARDIAASYFHPIAEELRAPGRGLLLVPGWPPALPLAYRRMLERAVLATGGGWLEPETPTQANPLACVSPGLRWRTAGEPGRTFLAPRQGLLADLAAHAPLGWANGGPGAGAYRPGSTLLVGERPGVARTGQLKHRLPFVSFDGAGCAPWLAEQLEVAGVPEVDLYWINAYDALSVPTDASFLADLRPARVVALGREAERWCKTYSVPHHSVPHPMYWMRFHHRERYPLLDVLGASQ